MPFSDTIGILGSINKFNAISCSLFLARISKTPFLWDPDTCYHVRRILSIAQHTMKFPFYDPLLAYPHGAVPVWSPLYDWILALPSFIISLGNPSDNIVIYSALILNLAFVFAQLLFVGLLIYRATKSTVISILSSFLIGVSGPQVRSANWQILDHDSLLLLLFSFAIYLEFLLFSNKKQNNFVRDVLFSSIIIALFFWTWPGSYIYVAVLALAGFLYVILSNKSWLLSTLAQIYLLAGFLVMPLAFIHHTYNQDLFRFEYVSFLTVCVLCAIGIFFYSFKIILDLKNKHKIIKIAQLLFCALLLVVLFYFSFTPVKEGAQYAAAQNKWLSTIVESQPLLYERIGPIATFTMAKTIDGFGYLAYVFPVAFIVLLFRWIKIPLELYSILIVATLFSGMLTLFQMKYGFGFSIPFGMTCALFIQGVYQKVTKKLSIGWIVLFAGALFFLLSPLKSLFHSYDTLSSHVYYDGLKWLNKEVNLKNAEINSSPVKDNQKTASVGVIAPWDLGHQVHLHGGLPTIADNFGFIYLTINPWEGFNDMAKFFLLEDEEKAIEILDKYKCVYVVIPKPFGLESYPELIGENQQLYVEYRTVPANGEQVVQRRFTEKLINGIGIRLSELSGSSNPESDSKAMNYKALKHFRLIYESPEIKSEQENLPPGSFKIFKYVKGTKLDIPVQGNAYYKLEALIIINSSRTFFYRQNGYLNEKIIVPYPTEKTDNYPYAQYYKVEVNGSIYEFN